MTTAWSGGIVEWVENGVVYMSVVFSWQLQEAYQLMKFHQNLGIKVVIGGPAVSLNLEMLKESNNKELGITHYPDAIAKHNPVATFTTRGCVRTCPFCIVPKNEGKFVELREFPVRPIVCDNNFLASSTSHFDRVIDALKPLRGIDFNQGLDARLLTKYHAERLAELNMSVIRMAWDNVELETVWMRAFQFLLDAGFPPYKIQSYVLINHNDNPSDALYRLERIRSLGARPNPMRYQPLDSIKRNQYISPNWTDFELKRFMRYWSRQIWLSHVPFSEYK